MSSDGFAVDLDALKAVHDRVDRLAGELAGPSRDVPGADVFGHGRLTEAMTKFAAEEERGRERLTAEAESIRDRLAETVRAYQRGDEGGASASCSPIWANGSPMWMDFGSCGVTGLAC